MRIDYLRVSVTNRCNLRCIYCNPPGDSDHLVRQDVLTNQELQRIVRLFTQCGIKKVRLTGGEPLLRDDIAELVDGFSSIDGIEDLSITTNGIFLASLAAELKAVGLKRVNISIDTLDEAVYRQMTGYDMLPEATRGIDKAINVGLSPVKINSVIVKSLNDSREQIRALANMSVGLPVAVRFVEYYPTDGKAKPVQDYVPNNEIKKMIEDGFGRLEETSLKIGYGPAVYFKIKGSAGAVGFISGRSSMFCRECNRLRLTCDGKVKPCLYSARQYDLKELIRNGANDEDVLRLLGEIIRYKGSYTKLNSPAGEFSMQSIGG